MNTPIKQNTEALNALLAQANALPDAGGSTEPVEPVEQATPVITVGDDGLITATAEQAEGYVEAGTKSATMQLTTQGAQTITPGTSKQTIPSGRYLTGTQTIKGDANLIPGNIKKGISIFGILGSFAGSGSGGLPGGISALASGTVIPASNSSRSLVVNHNLGVTPNFVAWIAVDSLSDAPVASMNIYGISIRKGIRYSSSDTAKTYQMAQTLGGYSSASILGGTNKTEDETTEWTAAQCTIYCNSTYKLMAGRTYRWFAGVADGIL